MAGRRIETVEIRELIRYLRASESDRGISRDLGMSRNTVAKYRKWARKHGFLGPGDLPDCKEVAAKLRETGPVPAPGPPSSLEPWRAFITNKRAENVEMAALMGLLQERGYAGSYSSLRRFIRKLEPVTPEAFLRIETKPGEEAQVDFGYAGLLWDPVTKKKRKAWVFVMTLSWSRHQYAEIVFDQKVETWLELHIHAFEWFGGVPERLVIDNLKAGIQKAAFDDPELNRSYRAFAEAYGFLIRPCRVRTPRHKGKVESGVRYVKRNALAGRNFADIREANEHLRRWVLETAGVRIHGTTHEKPLVRFETEKERLSALPPVRHEMTIWKQAKVHPDCHVVFDYGYYSAPFRLVGREVWVKATPRRVELYHEHERLATHPRAVRRGQRRQIRDHFPPEKLHGVLSTPVRLRALAAKVGPAAEEFIGLLLGERPLDRLRSAQGLLGLARKYGNKRLDTACRRALAFEEIKVHTVKSILKRGLDLAGHADEEQGPGPLPKTSLYARPVTDLFSSQAN